MTAKDRDQILTEYEALKTQAAAIELKLSAARELILSQIPAGQYGTMLVMIDEQTRENFSLKQAKAELSKSIFEKISGFISASTYKVLKVKRLEVA